MTSSVRRVLSPEKQVMDVARSKQVCIYVVEALLIAIYLPKGKDVYIHIRPTSVPEATVVQLGPAQLNPQLSLDS
jgi:hypothetical protein